jgi:hypothetical protein
MDLSEGVRICDGENSGDWGVRGNMSDYRPFCAFLRTGEAVKSEPRYLPPSGEREAPVGQPGNCFSVRRLHAATMYPRLGRWPQKFATGVRVLDDLRISLSLKCLSKERKE